MEKTPYAYEFLWHQIEIGFNEIKKKKYKELLKRFVFDEDIRRKIEKRNDYRSRDYEGGLLETTASLVSLSLCTYDNYPEIDIDLILTAIIMYAICKTFTKKECYEFVKDYSELVPFLFKKQRKKPSLELTVFDALIKFDAKIFLALNKKRKKKQIN